MKGRDLREREVGGGFGFLGMWMYSIIIGSLTCPSYVTEFPSELTIKCILF
jgi:hypothetical protein